MTVTLTLSHEELLVVLEALSNFEEECDHRGCLTAGRTTRQVLRRVRDDARKGPA